MSAFFRLREDGADLFVRLTPRSSQDAVEDIQTAADGRAHLATRVRAVPEKGTANAALEKLIAAALQLPRSSVSIGTGATARLKTVRLDGDPQDLKRRLEALAGRLAR